jgi:hypothetical protein
MKKTNIAILSICTLMILALGVSALNDANTPYTIDIRWIIPSDTSFTIEVCNSASTIDFNPASKTQSYLQPGCQNNNTNIPIINITNSGNVNQNFSHKMNEAVPTWVTSLKGGNNGTYIEAESFSTSKVYLQKGVTPGSKVPVFLWSDVTDALGGTYEREYEIASELG